MERHREREIVRVRGIKSMFYSVMHRWLNEKVKAHIYLYIFFKLSISFSHVKFE